jgi:hypothetical protein
MNVPLYEAHQQKFLIVVVIRECKTSDITFVSSPLPHEAYVMCFMNCLSLPVNTVVVIKSNIKKRITIYEIQLTLEIQ